MGGVCPTYFRGLTPHVGRSLETGCSYLNSWAHYAAMNLREEAPHKGLYLFEVWDPYLLWRYFT